MRLIRCLASLVLLVGLPSIAASQDPPSVEFDVVAWGAIAYVTHDCPIDERGRIERTVPAQVVCTLQALDVDSLPTRASFAVTSSDTMRVAVDVDNLCPSGEYPCATLTLDIVRRAGLPGVRIRIEAHPIILLAAFFPDRMGVMPEDAVGSTWPVLDTIMPINVLEGEEGRLCAYQGGYSKAIAKGVAEDGFTCPTLGPNNIPTFPVAFGLEGEPGPVALRPVPFLANLDR